MKFIHNQSNKAMWRVLVLASVVLLAILFGKFNAYAAALANSLISSQATASYKDSSGANQSATSNQVQTMVQQVGSFTLDATVTQLSTTVKNTKAGSSGKLVTVSHTVANTGNGSDGFNIVVSNGPNGALGVMATSVFLDQNNDGVADSTTPLCSTAAGASCVVPTQVLGEAGNTTANFTFLVIYAIPGSATGSTSPYSSGLITVTPATPALYTSPNTAASDVDNINLTLNAAFSANLAFATPGVAGPGNVAYPSAVSTGKRSLATASCPLTMTAARSNAPNCLYTTYTLNFSNSGAADGIFYANHVLPSGLSYVLSSAVWSGLSGIALSDSGSGNPAGINFAATGQNISLRVASVGAGAAQSVSFMVLVNAAAIMGNGSTSSSATYDSLSSNHTTADAFPGATNSNLAPFTVLPNTSVVLGSATGTAIGSSDSVQGIPLGTLGTSGADQNVVAKIISGGTVQFTHTLFNTGDLSDSFNLGAVSTFPVGSTIAYYRADGLTALQDTNNDGVVDTGSIVAGGSSSFIIQVQIPSVAPNLGPYTLIVQAKSVNDPSKFDASGDQVMTVSRILVDLTNTSPGTGSGTVGGGDLGAGPSPAPTVTRITAPGTGSIFTLFISNNDANSNTYTLSVSQAVNFSSGLPAGWTVKYVTAGTGCAGTVMASPINVAAGIVQQVDACVMPLPSTLPSTTNMYFRVASTGTAATSGLIVSDSVLDALTVTAASTYMSTLTPNNSGQLGAGGTVVYAHALTNTGTQTCGAYNLTATQTGGAMGWTYTIFLDVNGDGQIDPGDSLITAGTSLPVGGVVKYLVRVTAPGGLTAGTFDTLILTATYTDAVATNCGPRSATDTTTVVLGGIRAYQTQSLNEACNNTVAPTLSNNQIRIKPRQCITYQVIAVNEGTTAVSDLKITASVPANTALASTQPLVPCVVSPGVSVATTLGIMTSGSSAGSVISCGTAATMPPAAIMTMQYTVIMAP